jgi:YD repeat-containing protein
MNASNMPAGTTQITVGVQMRTGSGTSYFDNIRLQEGDFRTKFTYDPTGNYLTSVMDPLGAMINIDPEPETGNIRSMTDSKGNQQSFTFSLMDWLKSLTFPSQGALGGTPVNKTFSYHYDNNGNLLSIVDPNGKKWASFQYNEWNQMKQFEEKVSKGTTTSSHLWGFTYDLSGRLDKVTLPDTKVVDYSYDHAGRMIGLSNVNGTNSTSFSYDYDFNGNVEGFGETGSTLFNATYDEMDRLKKVSEPNVANFYENYYAANGIRTQLDVNYGTNKWTYLYEYDDANQPKSFKDSVSGQISYYLFGESGNKRKQHNANKTSAFYEYNIADQLTQLRVESDGAVRIKYRYEYDKNGNITKIWSDMDSTWVEYTYDSLDQLLLEKYSNGDTFEYQYDELGNRKAVIKNGASTPYSYNAEKNRLESVGSKAYAYDANGNVTSDGTFSYAWGDDNLLKEVKEGTTLKASFTYDALGRRETMTDSLGVTKTYHYDGNLITYVTESSGKVYRFAYDHEGKPVFMSYLNKQYWYHYDEKGSVIGRKFS